MADSITTKELNENNELNKVKEQDPLKDLSTENQRFEESYRVKKPLDSAPTYFPKSWYEQEAYYNDVLYKYINNAWVAIDNSLTFTTPLSETGGTVTLGTVPISKGGTNITTYTKGDILYASATNVLSKLAIGSDNQVLTVATDIPAWEAPATPTILTSPIASADDVLRISADDEQTAQAQEVIAKEVKSQVVGDIRIKFDLRTSDITATARGQIYINDVAVGALQSTVSTSYTTYTEDFTVYSGDFIDLRIVNIGGTTALTENFRIYYTLTAQTPTINVITN